MELLCQFCLKLFPLQQTAELSEPKSISHHSKLRGLIDSAETCIVCKFILDHCPLDYLQNRFEDVNTSTIRDVRFQLKLINARASERDGVCWALLLATCCVRQHKFDCAKWFSIVTCPLDSCLANLPIWQKSKSSLQEKYALAKSWLEECELSHVGCRHRGRNLPKRLLSVGSDSVPPRLILRPKGQIDYAALSHRWGDSQPHRTLQSNEEEFMNGIPLESLPRTFRDAIMVCRELGIPYLWVDSLCIAQDDPIEWAAEASKMKDAYHGSILTIAASDANNSLEGCFTDDTVGEDDMDITQFTTHFPDMETPLKVRLYSGDSRRRISKTILNTRGWVLQEQVLSHRILYCTNPELVWMCRHMYRAESGAEFLIDSSSSIGTPFFLNGVATQSLHDQWCIWMQDFSSRQLSVPADRLSAIAGMVQHFGDQSGYRHVLGCWAETMIKDLIWMRGEVSQASNALPWIPTWSWFSRCEDILFDFWGIDYTTIEEVSIIDRASIINADVSWSGTPLLSEIKSSELIIEGKVKTITLRVSAAAKPHIPPYMDVNDELPDLTKDPLPWRCAAQFDLEDEREDDTFTCILMRELLSKDADVPRPFQETFLILIPVEASHNDTYRRVGIGSFLGKKSEFEDAALKRVQII